MSVTNNSPLKNYLIMWEPGLKWTARVLHRRRGMWYLLTKPNRVSQKRYRCSTNVKRWRTCRCFYSIHFYSEGFMNEIMNGLKANGSSCWWSSENMFYQLIASWITTEHLRQNTRITLGFQIINLICSKDSQCSDNVLLKKNEHIFGVLIKKDNYVFNYVQDGKLYKYIMHLHVINVKLAREGGGGGSRDRVGIWTASWPVGTTFDWFCCPWGGAIWIFFIARKKWLVPRLFPLRACDVDVVYLLLDLRFFH